MRQEARVAKIYGGSVSPSSGAAITDNGDVRTVTDLIECKHTGTFLSPRLSISLKLDDFEKIRDEAFTEGRMPVMCLSIYCPDSPMANAEGCVDLTVRPTLDDQMIVSFYQDRAL